MRLIALEYHDIVHDEAWDESGFPGPSAATYKLSSGLFSRHLDALHRSSRVVLNDVGMLDAQPEAASPRVVITFDDGGSGYVRCAADELEQRGWRGHVFMTTSCIGRSGFLDATELRDLAQRGHVIGSHSRTHPMGLSGLPRTTIAEEWSASIADLQDALGEKVTVASVPGGFHSREVAELAASAGIRYLFTSEPVTSITTVAGCTVAGRYTLRRSDSPDYVARLVGNAPFARSGQWCQWNAKKVLKRLGGRSYRRVRELIIGP